MIMLFCNNEIYQGTSESNQKSCDSGHTDGVDRSFEQRTTTKKILFIKFWAKSPC